MSDGLLIDTDGRSVLRLTLDRSDAANALDEALIAALGAALDDAARDAGVRVVVLAGAGEDFSAGADLAMMARAAAADDAVNEAGAQRFMALLSAISSSPKPVVARVQGAAIGGGAALVAAADIAVAAEDAVFALPGARLGLAPAIIFPALVAAMGPRNARRFSLTGERFDAETARRVGLVHKVAMTEQLDAALGETVDDLLAGAPAALAETKALLRKVEAGEAGVDLAAAFARSRASAEAREGVAAFTDKRKPSWMT